MGFMGLKCVCDSDNAADLSFRVSSAVAKVLAEGLKEKGNLYNTNGPINVALIFEEMIIPVTSGVYLLDEDLVKIASECVLLLKKERPLTGEFAKDYNRMITSLSKFVSDSKK
jgi:hypothetical protein